ncbi:MAG: cytochrome b/b6 domain-containing protein [Maritimibacter sp.]
MAQPKGYTRIQIGLHWRLAIKAKRGAPALPENEPPLLKLAAQSAHLGLYGLMLLVPVAGLMAWFGQMGWAAELHEVMTTLLELLAILHVIGALYQHFYLKTDVLNRMRKPE